MISQAGVFTRDRPTVLSYSALGAYTFWLYGFGPALALLRDELRFSYTMIGVYSALWAGGSVLSGATFAAAAGRIGRGPLLWCSALAATAGATVFATTHTVVLTLAGAALLGFAGTTLQTTTQSVLADQHGDRRGQALVEANVAAAVCGLLAPPAIGLLQATPFTWRSGIALPALALAAIYLIYRYEPLPEGTAEPAHQASGSRLSLACRLLCLLVAVGIGAEFCVVYFGPELLTVTTGLPTSAAGAGMVLFYGGLLAGRIAGAGLTRNRPAGTLLYGSLAVALVGLLAMWLAKTTIVALTGLFAAGLGVANLFPLSLALVLAAARGQTDLANARAQLYGGLLVIVAPFILGALADHLGLVTAFAVAPALVALSCLLLYAGLRPHALTTAVRS